ncbi:hypothetical protein Pint_23903 [Pistacia integerrima]|uniref:Uncharacterized protein n=1 Tax=Pistacia integerrima TaxID=434235 RepID=A0ACC0YN85_9ROSI|nr:hypothetical protein Pint_23903 [Pistacia integerrima]
MCLYFQLVLPMVFYMAVSSNLRWVDLLDYARWVGNQEIP